jgi:phospholipid transport system substrate-binding protein
MKRWMRILGFCAVAAMALGGTTPARADDAGTRFLEARHRGVQQILGDRAAGAVAQKARTQRLSRALEALLDLEELSRRSLADHWNGLQPAQRDEFVTLLSQLVQQSYRKNLESTLDFTVRYTAESPLGDGVLVRTMARSKTNRRAPEVSIDYALHRHADSFRVYDVTTDGVSLVENYRRQFDRIIRRDGWAALIEKMRKKLEGGGNSL